MGKYKVMYTELSVYYSGKQCLLCTSLSPQGSFLVYPIEPEDTEDTSCQIIKGIPRNSPVKVLVRVYIVKVLLAYTNSFVHSITKFTFLPAAALHWVDICLDPIDVYFLLCVWCLQATSLAPTDPNGKADPYLVIQVVEQNMDTKDRYIPKQLNPIFGESVPQLLWFYFLFFAFLWNCLFYYCQCWYWLFVLR